jgi:hypothetical protein
MYNTEGAQLFLREQIENCKYSQIPQTRIRLSQEIKTQTYTICGKKKKPSSSVSDLLQVLDHLGHYQGDQNVTVRSIYGLIMPKKRLSIHKHNMLKWPLNE